MDSTNGGAKENARTTQPRTCQNPEADCYREPDEYVEWSEDFTSDHEYNQFWLCEQCAAILERGTHFSRNVLTRRKL